jgi:hypothetical protein
MSHISKDSAILKISQLVERFDERKIFIKEAITMKHLQDVIL